MGLIGSDFKVPQVVMEVWTFVKGLRTGGPFGLAKYTTATRPDATLYEGYQIYVTDAVAGQKMQYSDGDDWQPLG